MKNIVIAAGYATRLYPLTENFPKPLLKIGERSILDRILDDVDGIEDIDEHIIVTNHKFAEIFNNWVSERKQKPGTKPIRIIDDGTTDNENRLGAVKDLLLAIDEFGINDDIMVLAADNVLDFSFQGFVNFFKQKNINITVLIHKCCGSVAKFMN